jgi:SnoaL-like domain
MSKAAEVRLRRLEKEVRYLRDRQDIFDCIHRYTRGLDRLDAKILTRVYHSDAVDNHSGFVGYIPEFVKWGIALEARYASTHHGITTHTCEIDGDTAHTESYVHWFLRLKDSDEVRAGGGRYVDRLERRNGAWKITLRRLLMDWQLEADGALWNDNVDSFALGARDRSDPSYQRPLTLPAKLERELAARPKPKPKPKLKHRTATRR